jgi:hypothetical protein
MNMPDNLPQYRFTLTYTYHPVSSLSPNVKLQRVECRGFYSHLFICIMMYIDRNNLLFTLTLPLICRGREKCRFCTDGYIRMENSSSDTSANICYTTRCHIPEKNNLHNHGLVDLKHDKNVTRLSLLLHLFIGTGSTHYIYLCLEGKVRLSLHAIFASVV